MSEILFILCIFLLIPNDTIADADDKFFSKFYQKDYEVKDFRVDVISYNKSFLKEISVVAFKYNRTTTAVNITIMSLLDFTEENIRGVLEVYKRYGNEYKLFPIRYTYNLCKSMKNNILGYGSFKCGCISCPILKNIRQHVCNWTPDYTRLPPLMPDGQYQSKLNLTYNGEHFISVHSFGTVYRKVKII